MDFSDLYAALASVYADPNKKECCVFMLPDVSALVARHIILQTEADRIKDELVRLKSTIEEVAAACMKNADEYGKIVDARDELQREIERVTAKIKEHGAEHNVGRAIDG